MAKLIIYNFITINGFFKGQNEDTSWHKHGPEELKYSEEMLEAGNILLFGRITYEMMVSFWPSPEAIIHMPIVAKGMNDSQKIVFSRSLDKAEWNNTKIIRGNIIEEVKKLKQSSDKDMAVLGSGSIVSQFAEAGLVDEYQIMIDPVIIGEGTPIFSTIKKRLELKLIDTRVFKSGVVLLTYIPEY